MDKNTKTTAAQDDAAEFERRRIRHEPQTEENQRLNINPNTCGPLVGGRLSASEVCSENKRQMSEEELKAQIDALPIEQKIKLLQRENQMLHQKLNDVQEMIGSLYNRLSHIENLFHQHTHSHNGMGATLVPSSSAR